MLKQRRNEATYQLANILQTGQPQQERSYTPGFKTTNWKNSILTHQNYSRVNVHNKPNAEAQYIVAQTQETQKIYPVYNAHSYGTHSNNILETKSHTDIHPDEFSRQNRTIFKRKIEYKSLGVYEKCPPGETGQFVYSFSCNQYLNCWKGRGTPQNCGPGTLFNPKSLECDYPDKVECITGPRQDIPANIRVTKSVRQASCPDGFSGLIPNYTDCSKFISCNNGQSMPMDCPPGTLFDTKQNVCDHPNKCSCFNGQSGSEIGIQIGQAVGQQNQGQYHHTVYGQTDKCSNIGSRCDQNVHTRTQNNYGLTSGSTYGSSNGNSLNNIQQSGTHTLHPVSNSCNSQYQNCGQQTAGKVSGQRTGYGQSNPNLGYGQTTIYTHTINGQNPNQGVGQPSSNSEQGYIQSSTNGQSNDGFGYGQTYVQTFGHTGCNPEDQNCVQSIGHNVIHSNIPSTTCDPSKQNCANSNKQNEYPHQEHGQTTIHSQSYGENCNPSVQNCGHTEHDSGSVSDQTVNYNYATGKKCDPSIQNCVNSNKQNQYPQRGIGQTTIHTYNYAQNCNPSVQNCDQTEPSRGSIGDQTINYNYGTGKKCNPSTQNCQGQGSTFIRTETHNVGQTCNPSTQNCQGQGSTYHTETHNVGHTCDPLIQNCDQSVRQGYGSTSGQTQIYGTTHSNSDPFLPGAIHIGSHKGNCNPSTHNCFQNGQKSQTSGQFICDPRIHNCGQNTRQTETAVYGVSRTSHNPGKGQFNCDLSTPNCGQSSSGNGQIISHSSVQKCNPGTQNCGQDPVMNNGQSSSSVGRNYNTICNINDKNCQQSHSIVTRRTEPKCPDDFQGLIKHPSDCKKFLNCANGQTFIQDCAPGTLFNPNLGNCDFPYNVDCQSADVGVADSSHEVHWDRNDNIVSSTGEADNHHQTTEWYPKSSELNIYDQNINSQSNWGKIGLLSRPTHPSTTETAQNVDQTANKYPDYVDVFDPKEQRYLDRSSTTPRSAWPPPFPKGQENVDYAFDYGDGEEVTLEPDDIFYADSKKGSSCEDGDFHCLPDSCISQTMVCDGHRDCNDGKDELLCEEYIARFSVAKNSQLVVMEKQRWVNASYATCAMLCIQNQKFTCRSFNYRKMDRTCFLSDQNVGLTGALRRYFPMDYYELITGTVDCSDRSKYFECSNKKCLLKEQLCDGSDNCGNRQDEKNCKPEDLGYSIKLSGSKDRNEGRVEVKAFGKSGYICDDQFGIQDANVICKELGFHLGAAEVRGQSYFAKDLKENQTVYMMDDLDCFGNETTLLNCGFAGWGVHNCRDQEIAGIVCKTSQKKCGKGYWKCDTGNECIPYDFICDGVDDCEDNSDEGIQHCEAPTEIRLVNGSKSSEGRLEIKHHGIWGTVCDDDFNEDAAKVVCKYFGFQGTSTVKKDGYFGQGNGPIWLDQVSCLGNETELEKCTHWNWGEHNCDHNEDVGVICSENMLEVELQRNSKLPIRHETGLPKKCGFRKDNLFLEDDLIHARVVSGSVAKNGDYPWQAALKVKVRETSAHWCGAVIISSKWVLTAAHCLKGYTKGAYIIVAGDYNTDENEGTEQQKFIDEFFIHENFRKGHKMNNDIALIKVKGGGFVLNDDVQPICLPDTDTTYDQDLNCTISGFGSVKSGISAYSHNMMSAWIPIHSKEICKMPHIYGDAITESMVCAGFLDGGVDACEGDSGGPLACLDQGFFTLYGLTSWGQHCGHANKPGVYVKVANYRQWIGDIIDRHSQ
ncbi:hypothetical protein JTB14_038406 [Gonioctena quinquepunctata]|nr:hypothetical protein JTB14_038406 [Gonioctena quinquepunctata]